MNCHVCLYLLLSYLNNLSILAGFNGSGIVFVESSVCTQCKYLLLCHHCQGSDDVAGETQKIEDQAKASRACLSCLFLLA